jgi:hypothetical protein
MTTGIEPRKSSIISKSGSPRAQQHKVAFQLDHHPGQNDSHHESSEVSPPDVAADARCTDERSLDRRMEVKASPVQAPSTECDDKEDEDEHEADDSEDDDEDDDDDDYENMNGQRDGRSKDEYDIWAKQRALSLGRSNCKRL